MRIVILSLTPLAQDGRVLRAAQALMDAGEDILVIGREPLPRDVTFRCIGLPGTKSPGRQRLELLLTQAPASLTASLAPRLYWIPSERRQMLSLAIQARPDVVYCNDWSTLPIGAAVKERTGASLVYDSHEYAAREHIQNWKWRIVSHAAVVRLEQHHISSVDLIITVSEGIADGLQRDHRLPARPTVIRNLPRFEAPTLQVPKQRRQVLFHGLIRPERGLEELIDSASDWAFEGEIVIRGYGSAGYLAGLRARAAARGVTRLRFEPPVPPVDLIRLAASADVGYLALPGTTEHYEFALPNKLFEYLMAGLPVLATPRSEIRHVVERLGVGVVSELAPEALAKTLNNLTDDQLLRMRRAALEASRTLNWETEQQMLVTSIQALVSSSTQSVPN